MPRVKRGFTRHRRHKSVLDVVKGHQTSRGHLYRTAHQEMMKSLSYAYRDRRTRKREMRGLWIIRINAAARQNGLPYNRFIAGVGALGLEIDRKMLAEMAVNDPHGFSVLAARVKGEPDPVRQAPAAPVAVIEAPVAATAAVETGSADSTTFAPTAEGGVAAEATTEGSLSTVAEQEAAAAGAPEEKGVATNDPDEHRGDPQQGMSR